MSCCLLRVMSWSSTRTTPSKQITAARLRPMRGLKRLRSTRVICPGHAFVQNLRRGHYELGLDADPRSQLSAAFAELTLAV
jgi:IS6 family transposase